MQNHEPMDKTVEAAPWRDYLALSGTLVADPYLVKRLGHAAFLCRLLYNAAIEERVPFADAFAYRYALAEARRSGGREPITPVPSERFLPVPSAYALGVELTKLCARFPALRAVPRSMLANAMAEGCRARARHVKDCVTAKEKGRPLPKLRFRRADGDWSVSTDDFWLLRIGTDHAQKPAKADYAATPVTDRNRARRLREKAGREPAWADEKRRCGWNEDKVAAGLARRKARQDRDRDSQREMEAAGASDRKGRRVRRDSPKATLGARRMKADVVGLGRFRIDLGREIPEGAEKVRLTIRKPAWRGAKLEVRLVLTVPERKPGLDPLKSGRLLHEALRHLPADATRLDAVEAVRAAGLLVRGEDLGSRNPSCDDRGVATPPVRMPRVDIQAMKRAQRNLSRKGEARKKAQGKSAKTTGTTDALTQRRSRKAERERATILRIAERGRNRSRTRAQQDVARLLRDMPLLVATDPKRMVPPLLKLDGPAERRARREAGFPVPVIRGMSREEQRQRAMRRNLHATRFALRIELLAGACTTLGTIFRSPGHEGTTSGCPGCNRIVKKRLGERWHSCACGVEMPRDQASATETVGRGLLPFRESADPGGMIAAAIAAREEERAKFVGKRRKLAERSSAAAARRKEMRNAGAPPGHQVVVSPGPQTPTRKRVRGAGRTLRRIGLRADSN